MVHQSLLDFPFVFLLLIHSIPFQDQSNPYDSKKNCWIPDPEEGYLAGEITATKGDTVTIVTARGNEVSVDESESCRMFSFVYFAGQPQEGVGSRDESTKVREDRGHVQLDFPQRRLRLA